HGGKSSAGTVPLQGASVRKERCAGAERREVFEGQGKPGLLAENFGWKVIDRTVPREQANGAFGADAPYARIAVGGIPDQREVIRDQCRIDAELRPYAGSITNQLAPSVHLDDAIPANALRQILIRGPNTNLLGTIVLRGNRRSRRKRIVGLELDHGPHRNPHGCQRIFERFELRAQYRLDPRSGFVSVPNGIAERFDNVIGSDPDVRRAFFDHLEHGRKNAGDGAVALVFPFVEAPQSVKVAEELVRSVDEMDDHARAV